MSIYTPQRSRFFHYDFVFKGQRYCGSTMCVDPDDAQAFEDRVRHEIATGGKHQSPGRQQPGITRRRPEEKAGVYFIEAATGPIKIGYTGFLEHRLYSLRYQSPVALTLLAFVGGDRKTERAYHARFAAHRLHGEWFAPHTDILAEINLLVSPTRSPASSRQAGPASL